MAAGPALAKRSGDENSLLKYAEARLAESSNRADIAVEIYAETLKEQPNNSLLAGKTYSNAIETGKFDLALNAVNSLQSRGMVDAEMPLLPFTDAFSRRDWQSARAALAQLKTLGNFSFMAPMLEAWIATSSGEYPARYLDAVKKNQTAKYYHGEQKLLHQLALGRDRDASAEVEEIVVTNEARMAPVRIMVARHRLAQNNVSGALEVLSKKRTGPEARLYAKIEKGKWKNQAQKMNANIGTAFLFQRLSDDLATQRAHFLSLVMAQNAVYLESRNDYGRVTLARAYRNSTNPELATAEFANVPNASPYFLSAINAEIAGHIRADKFAEAGRRVDTALTENPRVPELLALKAQVLLADGKEKEAVDVLTKATNLAEELQYSNAVLANYWLSLGGAQEQAGIWPAGLESLNKANALQPNSANILNYLGYAQLERRENLMGAIAAIEKAYKIRSSSPAITDSLGWAYYVNGEHERAVGFLEKARTGQPQDPTINEHLGDAYWSVGRKYEARYAWRSAELFADKDAKERLITKIDVGLRPDLVSP